MSVCSSNGNRNPSPMSVRASSNPSQGQIGRNRENVERDLGGIRSSFSGKASLVPSLNARGSNVSCSLNGATDNVRRSSSGRECILSSRDNEHKENEKDPSSRHTRARSVSPSPSLSRGMTKNFMSPTISAASKINPFPRKKVLAERNESVRASASLSDGKFHFFSVDNPIVGEQDELASPTESLSLKSIENVSSASAMDLEKEMKWFSSEDPESKVDNSAASVFSKFEEPDMVVLSPEKPISFYETDPLPSPETPKMGSFIKSANHSPYVIAPLDADPSLPPYDPKTNWLSPRPQFLHYKPNPRIELYLSNGKRLEEENYSETSSDESSRGSASEDSQVTEDTSSVEMVAEEQQGEEVFIAVSQEIESNQSEEGELASQVEVAAEEEPNAQISEAAILLIPNKVAERKTEEYEVAYSVQISDAVIPPMPYKVAKSETEECEASYPVQISDAVIPPMPNKTAESETEECEVVSSIEMAAEEQAELPFSETRIPPMPDKPVEVDSQPSLSKSCFVPRTRGIAFLFILSLAFLPIFLLYTPSSLNTMLQPLAIVDLYNDSHTQLENLNALLPNVGPWSVPFGNYLSEMSNWYREVEKLRSLQLSNSTLTHISSSHVHDVVRLPVVDDTGLRRLNDGEIASGSVQQIVEPDVPADPAPVVVAELKRRLEMEEHEAPAEEKEGNSELFLYSFAELASDAGLADESSASSAEGSAILSSGRDEITGSVNLEQGDSELFLYSFAELASDAGLADESSASSAEGSAILSSGRDEITGSVNLEQGEEVTLENPDIISAMQDEQQKDHAEFTAFVNLKQGEMTQENCDIVSDVQDEKHAGHVEAENQSEVHSHDEENHASGNAMEPEKPEVVPEGNLVQDDMRDHPMIEEDLESGDNIESEEPEEVPDGSLSVEDNLGAQSMIDKLVTGYRLMENQGLFYLICALLAAIIAYMLLKRKKPASSSHLEEPVPVKEMPAKEFSTKPEASQNASSFHVSPSSRNSPIEMDMGNEPCPSEMSSFRKMSSSYYSKEALQVTDEAQSQERKPRRSHKRESLASSSSDHTIESASYGSFTTYGIVQKKYGDEEVVTPVRRSSRLRNHQVTSP
ncbi:hypothetical protein Droror1_Dr00006111 [Drosera rotundifolia]